MSTQQPSRPRPRPRPRPRGAAAPSSPLQSSSNGIPPSSPVTKSVVTIDEEDALFIRKPRTAQQWKKLAQIEKESKRAPAPIEISDDDDDDEDASSHRSRKYKKKSKQGKSLPNWTKKNITTLLTSSSSEDEDSDEDALKSIDNTPNGKRADKTTLKRKRERSRSKSITPPPALPIHRIQNARNLVRQTLDSVPRAPSPTWVGDDSTDNITLDPELAKIAHEIRAAPAPTHMGAEGGGPEVVTIKVKWQPHPLDDAAKPTIWGYKMKRHDDFRQVFDETADMAGVLSQHLVVSFDGKRVFSSATPHGIRIWAEAELEACDKTTYEYIRSHRHERPLSPSHDPTNGDAMDAYSRAGTQDLDESEEETSQSEKFKLILRSTQTSKDISLTVRPTTTCGAIVKAFLKSAGLSDRYVAQTPKKGGPRLCIDGDKMDPGSQIGDADLEDGDMVEVVGL